MNTKILKRIISVLILLLVACLVACGGATPKVSISEEKINIVAGESYTVEVKVENSKEDAKIVAPETDLIKVEGLKITALKKGSITVDVGIEGAMVKLEIVIAGSSKPIITYSGNETEIEQVGSYDLMKDVTAVDEEDGDLTDKISVSGDFNSKASGTYEVKYSVTDSDGNKGELVRTIKVLEPDTTLPVFEEKNNSSVHEVSYGRDYIPSNFFSAKDDRDGDITDRIVIKQNIDKYKMDEEQTLTLEVSDKAGNKATKDVKVKVVWDYITKVIGHRGSIYGVPNTEEAFLRAARDMHYHALECDVRVTSDGVLVINHDATYSGMTVENTTYAKLKATKITSNPFALPKEKGLAEGPYTGTICTLEEYLKICHDYNCKAIVELKSTTGISGSSTSNLPKLVEMLKKCDMYENTVILSSMTNCLKWFRDNGYNDIKIQKLVNSIESTEQLNQCIQYKFDISCNVTGGYSNSIEWVNKYREAGLEVSVWTFTSYVDYDVLQTWIDYGVDYVTVDWHELDKLHYYKKEEQNKIQFLDMNGKVLKTEYLFNGMDASAPEAPSVDGYTFTGWDTEFKKVSQDLTVNAVYKENTYNINYVENLVKLETKLWANKDEFVNAFYTDFFTWLTEHVDKVPGLTKNGDVYKKYTNDTYNGTVTFTSVDDILNMNTYTFESTLSSCFYKPITDGVNGVDYVPVVDELYFLNCEPYRTKYFALNEYFYNALLKSYTKYNKQYEPDENMKVSLFIKFHQWAQGTSIAIFNTIPPMYVSTVISDAKVTMPTLHLTYTVNEEFELPVPESDKLKFMGWYTRLDCEGEKVTKIEKGTFGNITLYAKWVEED